MIAAAVLATFLVGLGGIFLLPWFVPLNKPVVSASYVYGFNNRVASVAFMALVAALYLLLRKRRSRGRSTGQRLSLMLCGDPPAAGSKVFLVVALATSILIGILQGTWYQLLPLSRFQELPYFVSRLDLMALGLRPYSDFQFSYGPAMLYPPYWLFHLARGKLSIDGAYGIVLVAHWLAGNGLLYYLLGNLRGDFNKTAVFLGIALTTLNVSMGLSYTPLRFLAPIASLFFLHNLFTSTVSAGWMKHLKIALSALLLPLANLSISPEIGIAAVAGVTVYFAVLIRSPLRSYSFFAGVPILSFFFAVLVFSTSYVEAVFSFGSGGNNFPVLPTIHILFYLAAGCWVLPRLGIIVESERNQKGSLAAALITISLLLVPGALGRCDMWHVFYYGMGIFILFLALVATHPNTWWATVLMTLYLASFPVFFRINDFSMKEDVLKIIRFSADVGARRDVLNIDHLWATSASSSGRLLYGKLLPFRPDLRQLLKYEEIGLPFSPDEDVERFIKLSGRYVPEYYTGYYAQIFTRSAIERKVRDLQNMDVILVPQDFRNYLNDPSIFRSEHNPRYLSKLLFFPAAFIPAPRHAPLTTVNQIVSYILEHYTVVEEFRDSFVMVRNTATPE